MKSSKQHSVSKHDFDKAIGIAISESLSKSREKADPKLLEEYLTDNHSKYLKENMRIGFVDQFPEDSANVIDEITVNDTCRNFPVTFKVRYGKVTFGSNNEFSCEGITTDRVCISSKLHLSGWGQHSYVEEGIAMETAIIKMAMKHGLMVCKKICSWPHAKAIVQAPGEAHLRYFRQEKNETLKNRKQTKSITNNY